MIPVVHEMVEHAGWAVTELARCQRWFNTVSLDSRTSCHVMCLLWRDQSMLWEMESGYFDRIGAFQHSWLRYGDLILDVYPVAGFCPMMVSWKHSPWAGLYRQSERAYDDATRAQWKAEVVELARKIA